MCGLNYENILTPVSQTRKNKKCAKEPQQEMEGPGGYFREPGGYIVDMRNT